MSKNSLLGHMVKVINYDLKFWGGKRGEVIAVVKESQIDGYKRKCWKEYIVQFSKPFTWAHFRKEELKIDE